MGAAQDYTEKQLDGQTAEEEDVTTVTTAVTLICNNDPDRVGLVIINTGTVDAVVLWNAGVTTTRGILLSASGGNVSMDIVHDFTLPSRSWFAVVAAGSTTISCIRLRRPVKSQ